ncbi:hypothetical protein [Marinobacter sediminicola]|uniref:hypothetical protein n=1 Tax=Marinobacter sediminicola TaxID=3072994 RepID=UPI002810B7FE|nr:hypothetical protein [Marinobacter sp. F26243]
MNIKRMQEKELLEGLDADKAHADELAIPLPKELEPLERLKGSVKRYDQPFESVWDDPEERATGDVPKGLNHSEEE